MVKKKLLKLDFTTKDLDKLNTKRWKWDDNSVEEFKCVDVLQYIPGKMRANFMDELYRVLVPEGKATIICAYYSSAMAVADPFVEWPPICEQSFLYFLKQWRTENQITYPIHCNFEWGYGYPMPPELAGRSQEVQAVWIASRLNTVPKIQVVLTKKPC